MNEQPAALIDPEADPWAALRNFTAARIALGRTGASEPLRPSLQFKLAHALARDAVYSELNTDQLRQAISELLVDPIYVLHTQAQNRQEYLQRPDLGRRLHAVSVQQLESLPEAPADLAIILADGLSAPAIHANAAALLHILVPALRAANFTLAPLTVVHQARVAVSDEIGFLLKARVALILIGERPGLSAPDSMGAYFTYRPQPGLTDEARNCVSNIRPGGLAYALAADKLVYLLREALRRQLSGFRLKDHSGALPE